jgi:hypothetical protein
MVRTQNCAGMADWAAVVIYLFSGDGLVSEMKLPVAPVQFNGSLNTRSGAMIAALVATALPQLTES